LHQARQQPAHHAGGSLELQGVAAAADLLQRVTDQAEDLLHPQRPLAAFFGQAQAPCLALEQGIAQMAFQPGDLPAHRALGDVQLRGSVGEVAALGGDPEGVQRGQRREAFHRASSHDVRTWLV